MSRVSIPLTPFTRDRAHSWLEAACRANDGKAMEIRDAKRSDPQNAALWSLLGQIQRQRPVHNGVQMDTETYKALFMHALGREVRFVPTLDGTSMLPLGLRSSKLTKVEFSDLLELILAWSAGEGLTVEHFDAANDTPSKQGRAA
ncbi:MAG: NinB family protein [Brevundimonas sp.]|nr:MAG: NinB family protein [Brevundimonas sp.]